MRRLVWIACFAACGRGAPARHDAQPGSDGQLAVPVTVANATYADLAVVVSGPGRTGSSEQLDLRAPFEGVLTDLVVADGDHVESGQVLGWVVPQESAAAMAGAQQMMQSARTPAERRDAKRALALARRSRVRHALRAPEAAVVVSHKVDEGAHVSTNESIVTLVPLTDVHFIAQIAQPDLASLHPGDPATIQLSSRSRPFHGIVHAILPNASPTDLTVPVRIDFVASTAPQQLDLYGVAHVVVAHHAHALVVPAQAIIRDDVTGVSRVAVIDASDHAHWVRVRSGPSQGIEVELVAAPFGAGTSVVVSGQVGLPEGARVEVSRANS
jgi:multidrug efflux pump subunit AcrA (membrane-fusion protein)